MRTRSDLKASLEDSQHVSPTEQVQIASLMQESFQCRKPADEIYPLIAQRFDRLAVLRDAGRVCGCMGISTMERAHDRIVVLGSLAIRAASRGGAEVYSQALRVLLEQWFARPHKPVFGVGGTFNPFAYSAFVRRVGTLYPTPRYPVMPRELRDIAVAGIRINTHVADLAFDLETGIARGALTTIPRFDRAVNLADPIARFFVERNPRYAEGDLLIMVSPMTVDNLLSTVRNVAGDAMRRRVRRFTDRPFAAAPISA